MSAEERVGRQGQSEGKFSTGADLCTRTTAMDSHACKLSANQAPKPAAALMHVRAYLTLNPSELLQRYTCGLLASLA